ncbi:MAG: hypothetical protein ACSHW1_13290 [Yoonia sp.]|uniref:hypothetical protein n=1 Tax=Yoonia sp. TaxID=2212373 RepID=UPI003EFA7D57
MASAPPIVRLFLEEAGFGARIAQSAPCESEESENDTGMQRALIRQLSVTLENRAMKKALARASSDGAFNIHHLIAAVVAQNDRLPDAEDEDDESAQFVAEHKVIPRRPSELYRARSRRRARPV